MKRKPPSETTRKKNRARERERYRRLRASAEFRESERLRSTVNNKIRRANPNKVEADRRSNAKRMADNRLDPRYREKANASVKRCYQKKRLDKEHDHFMRQFEEADR